MGFINVYMYEQFKTWIIGVIVGIAVGLILLVVGVVVFIRLRRKWAT
jgi:flagellar biosynthesis protein FliR